MELFLEGIGLGVGEEKGMARAPADSHPPVY